MERKEVLSLQDMKALLGHRGSSFLLQMLARIAYKWLGIEKVNALHRDYIAYQGAEFTQRVLADARINVSYEVIGQHHLDTLSHDGSFITVANHPFGALDGLILIDFLGSLRRDYKLVANEFLSRITALKDSFIPVVPRKRSIKYQHNAVRNLSSIKFINDHLTEGGAVGFFPAGGVANRRYGQKAPLYEQPWSLSSVRVIRNSGVPVVPILFEGTNSYLFHLISKVNYPLTALKIPTELFNKRGQLLRLYVGQPIPPATLAEYTTDAAARDYLMHRTLNLRAL